MTDSLDAVLLPPKSVAERALRNQFLFCVKLQVFRPECLDPTRALGNIYKILIGQCFLAVKTIRAKETSLCNAVVKTADVWC